MFQYLQFLEQWYNATSRRFHTWSHVMVTVKVQAHNTWFIQHSQGKKTFPPAFSCDIYFPPMPRFLHASMPTKGNKMACVKAGHTNGRFPTMPTWSKTYMHYSLCVFAYSVLCGIKVLLKMSKRHADTSLGNSDKNEKSYLFIYSTEWSCWRNWAVV